MSGVPESERDLWLAAYRAGGMELLAHVNATQDETLAHYRVIVGELLRQSKCPLSVRELEMEIRRVFRFEELVALRVFRSKAGRRFLRSGLNRLKDFWNYTPRHEFDGRSPTQQQAFLVVGGADEAALAAVPIHVPSDFFVVGEPGLGRSGEGHHELHRDQTRGL